MKIPSIRHYLRSIRNDRSTFLINLIGLSTGMACTLLIYLFVHDELSIDRFHVNSKRIFQVMENVNNEGQINTSSNTPDPLAAALAKDFPEVELSALVISPNQLSSQIKITSGAKVFNASGQFAGKDYFRIFSFPLVEGAPTSALSAPNAVAVSETLAKNIFGSAKKAMGQSVAWELPPFKGTGQIGGVYKDFTTQASEATDLILSENIYLDRSIFPKNHDWNNHSPNTFVLLKKGADPEKFNAKIKGFLTAKNGDKNVNLMAVKYADIYLSGKFENGKQAGGRIEYVRLFSFLGLFILLIACINFMNLSTAKASLRAKEVGIKKTLGVERFSLIAQFIRESLFITLASFMLAIVLVVLLLPTFNVITQKHLNLSLDPGIVVGFLSVVVVTTVVAGVYPALYLSGLKPLSLISTNQRHNSGEAFVRKTLVISQFIFSMIFIVSVTVVYRQIGFIQNKNLGFDKDHVMYFPKEGGIASNTNAFLEEVKNVAGVKNAAAIFQPVLRNDNFTPDVAWPGKNPNDITGFANIRVGYGAIETLGITLKEGRAFSPKFGLDSLGVVFNETAIKKMGIKNPVGQKIRVLGKELTILGVANDFHFRSLHEKIEPAMFTMDSRRMATIMVALQGGKEKQAIDGVRGVYKKFNPIGALDAHFLDQDFQAQYHGEQVISTLSKFFAGLAIIISCLGLFGLAAFTADRRKKEIGIRKVLGATEKGIVLMISRDFLVLILLSVLIALPLAWYLTSRWLSTFQYSIELSAWLFLGSALLVLVIAFVTVGFQAMKAALANPVKSLRTE